MFINLPNGIGKIQSSGTCMYAHKTSEASNPLNILLPKVRRLNLIFVPALMCIYVKHMCCMYTGYICVYIICTCIFSINFSSSNLSGQEIYGTAGVVYRLVTTFPTSTILTMEREKLTNFTDILAQATCICAQKASEISSVSVKWCVVGHEQS